MEKFGSLFPFSSYTPPPLRLSDRKYYGIFCQWWFKALNQKCYVFLVEPTEAKVLGAVQCFDGTASL